jgi:hypothetical protein
VPAQVEVGALELPQCPYRHAGGEGEGGRPCFTRR